MALGMWQWFVALQHYIRPLLKRRQIYNFFQKGEGMIVKGARVVSFLAWTISMGGCGM